MLARNRINRLRSATRSTGGTLYQEFIRIPNEFISAEILNLSGETRKVGLKKKERGFMSVVDSFQV